MTQKLGANPWITIWTKPVHTIRGVLYADPKIGFFYLAAITFLQHFFFFIGSFYPTTFSFSFFLTFLVALIVSPFLGMLWFNFIAFILYSVGKRLHGFASYSHIKVVVAWSHAPMLINLAMWFFLLSVSSEYLFLQYSFGLSMFFIQFISLIATTWSFAIMVLGTKEVQGFSLLKSIINVAVSYLIILSLVSIILLFVFIF